MILGKKKASQEVGCSTSLSIEGVKKKGKGKCRPTRMSEILCISSNGHRQVIEYNEFGQLIGESVTKLKSFIRTAMRFHVPITYQSWKDVAKDLKDKIYEQIEVIFSS